MKKPAKPAPKKNNNKPQKKPAKPAAKKAAPVKAKNVQKSKVVVKAKFKAPIKSRANVKKPIDKKKPLKKAVVAKKVAPKKAPVKVIDKNKLKQQKLEMFKKNQKNIQAQKDAAKKAKDASKKAKEAAKAQLKNQKELEKKLKLKEKEQAKLAAKAAKEKAKLDAKNLKLKGKKGGSFEEEEEEELNAKPRSEDDEEDDDFVGTKPVKVKMTFDEEFDEEIPVKKKKSSVDDNIKDNLAEEILALSDEYSINEVFASIRSMELFKVDNDECVVRGCDNPSTTNGYCRYHYLKLWKDVKKKELILQEGKLAKIIEELVRKYPMKYIEAIVQDLADDKSFNHVLKDLDIETEEADLENFDDEDLLDDDQDIAFETKVVKPSFDD